LLKAEVSPEIILKFFWNITDTTEFNDI